MTLEGAVGSTVIVVGTTLLLSIPA